MEQKQSENEFEGVIDEAGRITVPPGLAKRFASRKIHVRLHAREIAKNLQKNNVTEGEVEQIANLQLESREQVIKFLLSEGALQGSRAFVRRAKGLKS